MPGLADTLLPGGGDSGPSLIAVVTGRMIQVPGAPDRDYFLVLTAEPLVHDVADQAPMFLPRDAAVRYTDSPRVVDGTSAPGVEGVPRVECNGSRCNSVSVAHPGPGRCQAPALLCFFWC